MHGHTEDGRRGAAPLEIERKYLIAWPDVAALERNPDCERVDIVQTYLRTDDPRDTLRVRRWESGGKCVYIKTYKRKLTALTRIEREEEIAEADYEALRARPDPDCRPIVKRRYRVKENGFCYEIDVFPEWTDRAILEIELTGEDQPVLLPDWVSVIREVTDDPRYTNRALARRNRPWPD
ncbi:MAG: hypothetical protein IKO07_12120 [Clostridia bacterium]|nr:hypothetical protein [Clostridia bacterium]